MNISTSDDPPSIVNSRFLTASPETVFRAFSNPDILSTWWGPEGFTNTFKDFDFKPGGLWNFVMHAPDGAHYEMTKQFVEIVENERIVLKHLQEGHDFQLDMSFADESSKTRLTWVMKFDSPEETERLSEFLAEKNEENLDRLEAVLAKNDV